VSDNLDVFGLSADGTPKGASFTTGTVYQVDVPGRRVQVGVQGGTVWLPANAARYKPGGACRVLLDQVSPKPALVLGAVDVLDSSMLGQVVSGTSGTLVVAIDASGTTYTVPAPTGTYTPTQSAWLSLSDWGVPIVAFAPNSTVLNLIGTPTTPPTVPTTTTATATIGPQVTGTWRSSVSRWDQWNPNRYGLGATPIYQGNAYGSGPLAGFAGYGNQVVNLAAISIQSITMTARKGADGNSAALTVQGSASGSRPGGAPSSTGDTASTASIGSGGAGSLAFTSNMREAFRTGTAKGLVAVGGDYGGFGGFGTPGSFVLTVKYTRNI